MILARIFTKIYKKSGIILIDSKGQKYICGNPRKDKPITIKLLKENLKWKLLVDPELEFPEAYMRGEIIVENASRKEFLMEIFELNSRTWFFTRCMPSSSRRMFLSCATSLRFFPAAGPGGAVLYRDP